MAYECCAVFGGYYVLLWVGAVVALRDPEAVSVGTKQGNA